MRHYTHNFFIGIKMKIISVYPHINTHTFRMKHIMRMTK